MSNSNSFSKKKNSSKKSEDLLDQFANQISNLSYEESIKQLDVILNHMQEESLPVEQLKISYYKANKLIEHCETLLENVEQEIIEINESDID